MPSFRAAPRRWWRVGAVQGATWPLDDGVGRGGTAVQTLMAHDLVDRYRLLVYPVVLGNGKRLFREGIPATLKLLESQAFSSGVVAVVYEPERQ